MTEFLENYSQNNFETDNEISSETLPKKQLKSYSKKLNKKTIQHDEHTIEIIDDYEKIKKVFELNNFKMLDPLSYATIRENGSLILRSKKDFSDVYENLSFKGIDKNGLEKDKPFIKKWL